MPERALTLSVPPEGRMLSFTPERLVIAGYTGRDAAQVARHVAELAREGIAPPPTVPAFWELPAELLTTADRIEVASRESSGEVEPVLLCAHDGWYVGVGSDHTARDLERVDVGASKAACPKVLGTEVLPYDVLAPRWSAVTLRSWTDGRQPYQVGSLALLLPLPELLTKLERALGPAAPGTVVFLGTVPLSTPGFVVSDRWTVALEAGETTRIETSYAVAIAEEDA